MPRFKFLSSISDISDVVYRRHADKYICICCYIGEIAVFNNLADKWLGKCVGPRTSLDMFISINMVYRKKCVCALLYVYMDECLCLMCSAPSYIHHQGMPALKGHCFVK